MPELTARLTISYQIHVPSGWASVSATALAEIETWPTLHCLRADNFAIP